MKFVVNCFSNDFGTKDGSVGGRKEGNYTVDDCWLNYYNACGGEKSLSCNKYTQNTLRRKNEHWMSLFLLALRFMVHQGELRPFASGPAVSCFESAGGGIRSSSPVWSSWWSDLWAKGSLWPCYKTSLSKTVDRTSSSSPQAPESSYNRFWETQVSFGEEELEPYYSTDTFGSLC